MQRAAGGSVGQRGWASSAAYAGWVEGLEVGLRFRGRGCSYGFCSWSVVVECDFASGMTGLDEIS